MVICGISVLNAKVIRMKFKVNKWQDKFLFDQIPDDATKYMTHLNMLIHDTSEHVNTCSKLHVHLYINFSTIVYTNKEMTLWNQYTLINIVMGV